MFQELIDRLRAQYPKQVDSLIAPINKVLSSAFLMSLLQIRLGRQTTVIQLKGSVLYASHEDDDTPYSVLQIIQSLLLFESLHKEFKNKPLPECYMKGSDIILKLPDGTWLSYNSKIVCELPGILEGDNVVLYSGADATIAYILSYLMGKGERGVFAENAMYYNIPNSTEPLEVVKLPASTLIRNEGKGIDYHVFDSGCPYYLDVFIQILSSSPALLRLLYDALKVRKMIT